MLWNIDLTLVDVAKVIRPAFAEAFKAVTGRPLVQLPQMAGRTEREFFFDAMARNGVSLREGDDSERLVSPFSSEFASAFGARRDQLVAEGLLLPGAAQALAAVAQADGVVQSVLTGSSRPNAAVKLRAFRLDRYVDMSVGGFAGSDPYPKGALLELARQRAEEKYKTRFSGKATIYIADSPRDVNAAKIAGAYSLAVASGRATSGELRDSGADTVLSDLTDVSAILDILMSPV